MTGRFLVLQITGHIRQIMDAAIKRSVEIFLQRAAASLPAFLLGDCHIKTCEGKTKKAWFASQTHFDVFQLAPFTPLQLQRLKSSSKSEFAQSWMRSWFFQLNGILDILVLSSNGDQFELFAVKPHFKVVFLKKPNQTKKPLMAGSVQSFAHWHHLLDTYLPDAWFSKANLLRVAGKSGNVGTSPVSWFSLSVIAVPSRSHVKLNYLNLLTCMASAWWSGDLPRLPPAVVKRFTVNVVLTFSQGTLPLPKDSENHPYSLLSNFLITYLPEKYHYNCIIVTQVSHYFKLFNANILPVLLFSGSRWVVFILV